MITIVCGSIGQQLVQAFVNNSQKTIKLRNGSFFALEIIQEASMLTSVADINPNMPLQIKKVKQH